MIKKYAVTSLLTALLTVNLSGPAELEAAAYKKELAGPLTSQLQISPSVSAASLPMLATLAATSPVMPLNSKTGSMLKKGYIPGYKLRFGMTMQQVQKIYGQPVRSDYYLGGEYFKLSNMPNAVFFFEGPNHTLSGILIVPPGFQGKTFTDIRKALGKPDSQENDFLEGYDQVMMYTYDKVTMYFGANNGKLIDVLIVNK
ncbi:hypothetical protein [Paenibacillus bovis]|uniref:DUF4309 domain-containing protein n=1 Tax=Paenibacillus bovis TaxID=1616788 RepID=A0A172ZDN6_9BACL|nr:hypothetical protein [Paenibacillus bovis]ANF95766.1 hypothetical protein AR543_06945 [Paenibacillus bovis]